MGPDALNSAHITTSDLLTPLLRLSPRFSHGPGHNVGRFSPAKSLPAVSCGLVPTGGPTWDGWRADVQCYLLSSPSVTGMALGSSQEKALHKRLLYPYVLQTPQIHVQTKHISFEASVSLSTRIILHLRLMWRLNEIIYVPGKFLMFNKFQLLLQFFPHPPIS